jgi:nucleoid-associated protein YgaU
MEQEHHISSAPSNSQPVTQSEEFNPTPFPVADRAQHPEPQEFGPPEEFENQTPVAARQATTSQTNVGQTNQTADPFGDMNPTVVTQSKQSPAESENEQFSTQSQSQDIAQSEPSPANENPFGVSTQSQTAQPIPKEPVAQPTSGDPFSAAPLEVSAAQSVPIPVENDPRFGDFQPAPAVNQYEANPSSVPNELPSDVFAQMSSHQLASDGANGYGQMQPADRPEVYVVRAGDNYWNISKRQYGTVRYFMALARYNQPRIPDPKKMQPGMKVLTPTREVLESRNPDLFPKYAARTAGVHNVAHQGGEKSGFFLDANGTPMFRVGPDDTLGGIAQKHLGRFSRWVEIYQMNQHRLKNPNALSLGDVLELPADASRVSMVRHASGVR